MDSIKKIPRVGLLCDISYNWMYDLLFACDFAFELHHIDDDILSLKTNPNPYHLSSKNNLGTLIVTSNWVSFISEKFPEELVPILKKLASRYRLVGIDGSDTFALYMPSQVFKYLEVVIKAQGVYKDKELYNYKVGTQFHGGNWTEKKNRNDYQYSYEEFEKIKLGPPCFISIDHRIRKKIRGIKPNQNPFFIQSKNLLNSLSYYFQPFFKKLISSHLDVHCIGSLTHYQRLEVLEQLSENRISGAKGIINIPSYVFGQPNDARLLAEKTKKELVQRLQKGDLFISKRNRIQYLSEMLNHKIILAPCGYGELSFRMGEAHSIGRALLCQDISHINIAYPFKENENVAYCKSDFSNLLDVVKDLLHSGYYENIAKNGSMNWNQWIDNYKTVLQETIISHVINSDFNNYHKP